MKINLLTIKDYRLGRQGEVACAGAWPGRDQKRVDLQRVDPKRFEKQRADHARAYQKCELAVNHLARSCPTIWFLTYLRIQPG